MGANCEPIPTGEGARTARGCASGKRSSGMHAATNLEDHTRRYGLPPLYASLLLEGLNMELARQLVRESALASLVLLVGCGKGTPPAGMTDAASSSEKTPVSAKGIAPPSHTDDERERNTTLSCERKAEDECIQKSKSSPAYFATQRQKIGNSPFDVRVERVWIKGTCHKGDVPAKREDSEGLKVIIEGKGTYKGDDLLTQASLDGVLYLDTGGERFVAMRAEDRAYSYWGGTKEVSKLLPRVRGSDPWAKGQERSFHWESRALNEAFCEVKPKEVGVILELDVFGAKTTTQNYPIKHVPVEWDEVVGMAARERVTVRRPKGEKYVDEAADSYFTRLDKALIVGESGKPEWVSHASLVQPEFFKPGSAAKFPAKVESAQWAVTVNGITTAKDFGGYLPAGEDQFVAILDVEIEFKNTPDAKGKDPKPAKAKSVGFKLETSPGTWRDVLGKATGQLDGTTEIQPGNKVAGKLAFARQRFERPFRLQVSTPDRSTLFAEVFTYDVKPERWK